MSLQDLAHTNEEGLNYEYIGETENCFIGNPGNVLNQYDVNSYGTEVVDSWYLHADIPDGEYDAFEALDEDSQWVAVSEFSASSTEDLFKATDSRWHEDNQGWYDDETNYREPPRNATTAFDSTTPEIPHSHDAFVHYAAYFLQDLNAELITLPNASTVYNMFYEWWISHGYEGITGGYPHPATEEYPHQWSAIKAVEEDHDDWSNFIHHFYMKISVPVTSFTPKGYAYVIIKNSAFGNELSNFDINYDGFPIPTYINEAIWVDFYSLIYQTTGIFYGGGGNDFPRVRIIDDLAYSEVIDPYDWTCWCWHENQNQHIQLTRNDAWWNRSYEAHWNGIDRNVWDNEILNLKMNIMKVQLKNKRMH